ncbi:MAG: PilN domain-containing protein [Oligoflexales bacterium]|nr:PilN domain-containing protein [Oligoflexales bacterium]
MIKINLAPSEELENKLWFLSDLIFTILVASFALILSFYYLGSIESDIADLKNQKMEMERSRDRLKPEMQRFDDITKQLETSKEKIESLKRIVVSKISRYKPIIIFEHLQRLKSEGLWFTSINDDSKNEVVHVSGGAFDNLLVAEFMSYLEETKKQDVDAYDLRTQVYFKKIDLEKVSSVSDQAERKNVNKNVDEKAQKAFDSTQDASLKNANQVKGDSLFPEIENFPKFILNLKYAERGLNK